MGCEIVEHKRVFFVLWGKPEPADVAKLRKRVATLYDKVGPFVLIARVPATAEAPSETMRRDLAAAMRDAAKTCASYHAVLEGTGFVSAAKRAVLTTLFIMSGHHGKFHVHSGLDQVLEAVPLPFRGEVMAALRKFESRGLFAHTLLSIPPPRALASVPPGAF
jgi:hypothetical protein